MQKKSKAALRAILWCVWVILVSCSSEVSYQDKGLFEVGDLLVDNRFAGARMNKFSKVNPNIYKALILPENTPINPSPWYSFKIQTKRKQDRKNITLILKYPSGNKPRYIPKLSRDGKSWRTISQLNYSEDTIKQEAYLKISLSHSPLWISAQESFPSQETYQWADSIAKSHGIQPQTIGRSTLKKKQLIALVFPAYNPTHKAVIFAARQHPPEITGGVIAYEEFMHTIMGGEPEAIKFRSTYNIIALPMINPDGIDLGHWRHNVNGQDLNRDWIDFKEVETQAVRNFISKKQSEGVEIVFGIDFHSSHTSYLLSEDTTATPEKHIAVARWYRRIRETWPDHFIDLKFSPISKPYLHNWFYRIGADGVTYEEADETPRQMIRERAKRYAETLMHTLNRIN